MESGAGHDVTDSNGRPLRVWNEVEAVAGDVVTFTGTTAGADGETLRADRTSLQFLDVPSLAAFVSEAGLLGPVRRLGARASGEDKPRNHHDRPRSVACNQIRTAAVSGAENADGRRRAAMNRKLGAVGAALTALALVTGCGSQPATTAAARSAAAAPGRAAACPPSAPRPALPPGSAASAASTGNSGSTGTASGAGTPDGAALVPAGPLTAAICQYAGNGAAAKGAGMPGRVTLTGVAAAGLAAVLDSAQPVTPPARRCDRPRDLDPFAQEIIFSYAKGRERRVTIAFTDCNLGLAMTSTQAGELPLQIDADLFEYTSITTRRAGTTPAPAVIGLSAAAAVRQAGRQHFTVTVDGAVLDQSATAGTVVFQSPPARARDSGPGRDLDVVVATGRAPACAAGQLALSYLGGAASAGNDFGTVLVRDTSARPCTLTGPLLVTGLGADGRPDTSTRRDPVSGPAVLTPAAGPVRWRPPGELAGTRPGELVGMIQLMSEYRDGPADVDRGLCEPLWVTPASWRVVVPGGSALTIPNADPASPARLVSSGGFVTCRGRLGVVPPAAVTSP
jgi:hypothetical protein